MRIITSMLSGLLILLIMFRFSLMYRILLRFGSCETTSNCLQLNIIEAVEPVQMVESHVLAENGAHGDTAHGTKGDTTAKPKASMAEKELQDFDARLSRFLGKCQVHFFMTWIASARSFGARQFLAVESVLKVHPHACLVILSKKMDSRPGCRILRPLLDRGYRVAAMDPDLTFLFNNTPGKAWLSDIQSGRKDPGSIPLSQNLSNLIRLAALYKYGGIYLDTDFIVLRDFFGLRNAIGVQSYFEDGIWETVNNAVLVFDKNHPLLYEFMKDFNANFNGSRWGHNGPDSVTRVIKKTAATNTYNLTILARLAFYPVHYDRINALFKRPDDPNWARNKLLQLNDGNETYGIHLWNQLSGRTRIEEGSIMANLISNHCIICHNIYTL